MGRRMELAGNAAFEAYREQYYEGGASSVYAWRTATGFATAVAIRKVFQLCPFEDRISWPGRILRRL